MYITADDFKPYIRETRLQQLIDDEADTLTLAAETAEAVVKDALYSRYDTDSIFTKTGTARDRQVVRWVTVLALYYLYERLPDKLTPERATNNYYDTIAILTDIEDGKKSTALELKRHDPDDPNDTTPAHKFRWGGNKERSH